MSFHFRDLMQLDHNKENNVVDLGAIVSALPNTPESVARQVYSEHGRLAAFHALYGDIDLSQLKWQLSQIPASDICAATTQFDGHVANVMKRIESFDEKGWECIDSRPDVITSWKERSTWLVPPVLLSGDLVGSMAKLHLVEGHTRVGALRGLLKKGVISGKSLHSAWLGCPK